MNGLETLPELVAVLRGACLSKRARRVDLKSARYSVRFVGVEVYRSEAMISFEKSEDLMEPMDRNVFEVLWKCEGLEVLREAMIAK